MSYIDKLNTMMDELDVGKPIFPISVNNNNVRVREERWKAGLEGADLYSLAINRECDRTFDKLKKEYYINREYVIININRWMHQVIRDIFLKSSPAVAPKRTKVYKAFINIMKENRHNEKFMNSIFDIAEYYYQVTETDSIDKKVNDVHRKNIYQLLCLMEKSYGKNKTNSK